VKPKPSSRAAGKFFFFNLAWTCMVRLQIQFLF
jgi:hypothetical protein